jgi:DNA repair protein RecN (Recombination protein N)
MLHELSITDFAIIEKTTFSLSESLNALTGETGAGKSILLDALGSVLGSRVSSDFVRTGARSARVEAVFSVTPAEREALAPVLDELGVDLETDEDLILTREIQASGRSTARINGRLATASLLAQVGSALVDIHGQSDHLAILHAGEQMKLLDRYARATPMREDVAQRARSLRAIRLRLQELQSGSREREHQLDLLRFQAEEIGEAALAPGEDEALIEERTVLQSADALRSGAQEALVGLTGADDAVDTLNVSGMLRNVERAIHHITAIDSTAQQLGERATELVVLAEDLARDLRTYGESIEAGPERLQAVEDRLSQIQGLKRKYGPTIEDVIAFGQHAQEQLDELTGASFDVEVLQEQEQTLTRELAEASLALSETRQHAAAELSARIEMSIAELRMGRSQVEIRITHRDDPKGIPVDIGGTVQTVHFDETGIDVIEFLIAPNAGESLKPLGRIASGGETARLMLAVKSILSDIDTTPTLVFDEIDVGVGGRSGQVVGTKLRRLADDHQVIVVTHLPQIAAQAERHFAITKSDKDSRTISEVRELDNRQRIEELAAMIDGLPLTDHAIASATDMLERSRTKV